MRVNIQSLCTVVFVGAVCLVGANITQAQCTPDEWATLEPSDGASGDKFGSSAAVDGDVYVVGAPERDEYGQWSGAAYVYRFDGETWIEEAKLVAPDGAAYDRFGHSVAISGDTILVGAKTHDALGASSGAAYVFHYDGTSWVEDAKLLASDGEAYAHFGASVALSGDTVLIGADYPYVDVDQPGAAYVFRYDGAWVEEAKLMASDPSPLNHFGYSVSLDGDAALIGAHGDDDMGNGAGAAYVFRFDGSTWAEEAKLLASDGAASDIFGTAVSVSGDTALIGARSDDDSGTSSGSAYVFRFDGTSWLEEAKLLAYDGAEGDRFGESVAVSGNIALVGAPYDNSSSEYGSAYVFQFDGAAWNAEAKLWDYWSDSNTGYSVAIASDFAVVGAPYLTGDSPGKVFVFRGLGDCNGNGVLDMCDVDDQTSEDCNGNLAPDECDVVDGTSEDCTGNSIPDECEPDCNLNGVADSCDILDGTSEDCTDNGIPDECEPDCNQNGIADVCDIADGTSEDCAGEGVPDECEPDCNGNGVADSCDILDGTSEDCAGEGVPDECEPDCNGNGVADSCDVLNGTSVDRDEDGIPDECEINCYADQFRKVYASDGGEMHRFGSAVAIDGDVALIGASGADGLVDRCGAAYVLRWDGMEWLEEAKLMASDDDEFDEFGYAVALDGNVAIIGALDDDDLIANGGAAYIFRYAEGQWTEEAKLTASDGSASDYFGYAVSISGNVAAIGTDYVNAAYVFRYDGATWQEEVRLTDPNGVGPYFGRSVCVQGDTLLVGDSCDDEMAVNAGAAHAYRFDGVTWIHEAKLIASDGQQEDYFGCSVSLSGDTALIGAFSVDDQWSHQGAAYVFRFDGAAWVEEAKLMASDGRSPDEFGYSVALSNDTALIGAPVSILDGQGLAGAAYVYHYDGAAWTEAGKLISSIPRVGPEALGWSVALSGDTAVAGAWFDFSHGQAAGSAYIFRGLGDCNADGALDVCEPDCNGNGIADECDITAGASEDCTGNGIPDECEPDCNGNGVADSCDIDDLTSEDCTGNGVPDECEPDCNGNGVADSCDIDGSTSEDCTGNGVPDECEPDCNGNGVADSCDIDDSTSEDCTGNGVPDECEPDCNGNGVADSCDIAAGMSEDRNRNGVPDECDAWCVAGEHRKLTAVDGESFDYFGGAVAIDGNTAVVGAYGDDDMASSAGAAYVYYHDGVHWVLGDKLTPADLAASDVFGTAVSLAGDVLLVGAPGSTSADVPGAAYVFRHDGTAWIEEARLTAADGEVGDEFGCAVSLSGDIALIGARYDDDLGGQAGAAYVFRYDGSTWVEEAKLLALDGDASDSFGSTVSISGDVALIGVSSDDDYGHLAGAAYVFRYDGGTWNQDPKLYAADAGPWGSFGSAVCLAGDTALIGAPAISFWAPTAAAYVFRYDGVQWGEQAKFTASDGESADQSYFGSAVSLSGDFALIGAYGDDDISNYAGAAYIFHFDGAEWVELAKLTAMDGAESDNFGGAVSLSGDMGLIGAWYDDDLGSSSGSAYIFRGIGDCNISGALDVCDITAGASEDVNANGTPDECEPLGDLNCDGWTNHGDIDAFVYALSYPDQYPAEYPDCDIMNGDINGDGWMNNGDIDAFINLLDQP